MRRLADSAIPRSDPGKTSVGLVQEWPGNAVAALACSLLCYHAIEKPMITLGRKLAGRSLSGPAFSNPMVKKEHGEVPAPAAAGTHA
jgi:peptidoglycan/LPS O-acetylase OafA/YrhL